MSRERSEWAEEVFIDPKAQATAARILEHEADPDLKRQLEQWQLTRSPETAQATYWSGYGENPGIYS